MRTTHLRMPRPCDEMLFSHVSRILTSESVKRGTDSCQLFLRNGILKNLLRRCQGWRLRSTASGVDLALPSCNCKVNVLPQDVISAEPKLIFFFVFLGGGWGDGCNAGVNTR